MAKDADWIKGLHIAIIKALSGGNMQLCRGVHMDNTKANRKAMTLMEEEYPWMVNLGCAGHGISLSIKDLGNGGKLRTTVGATLETCKMLSNAIGDSEKLRALVQVKQRQLYDGKVSRLQQQVQAFATHSAAYSLPLQLALTMQLL